MNSFFCVNSGPLASSRPGSFFVAGAGSFFVPWLKLVSSDGLLCWFWTMTLWKFGISDTARKRSTRLASGAKYYTHTPDSAAIWIWEPSFVARLLSRSAKRKETLFVQWELIGNFLLGGVQGGVWASVNIEIYTYIFIYYTIIYNICFFFKNTYIHIIHK